MFNIKPKMFEEAKKSTASENLIVNIAVFIVIWLLIMIAESVIPGIMSNGELQEKMTAEGLYDNMDFSRIMEISTEVSMQPKYFIPSLLCTAFGTLISIIYCHFIEARHLSSMGMRRKKAGIHYLQGLAVGIVLISATVLPSALFGITDIEICTNINFGLIGLYLLGFLVQGMSEEFIFRGYFMNTLGSRHNPAVAVIISASAFSLAHIFNPGFNFLIFINLALFGAFASLYMIYFDDIWGVCAIHSVWNFTQGNFYGIRVSGTSNVESIFRTTAVSDSVILTGGDFGAEGSIVTTVVLAAASAFMLYKINKKSD
ncbi:MAG: CPBP family intramembrane metalloprotease [Ruminococcus flavefaciens]|nr:CPBP family intramembrane metalloprotease [Ruminococcus flavefaciens]MCM1229676.1 CPBP family intramembrane metalloprotease [Ruminococcus flavefaciens]